MKYYYRREDFAEKILKKLSNFELSTTYSFMLFEGRRKGKTSFLLNDIIPIAKEKFNFHVFYFSFMNYENNDIVNVFKKYLSLFLTEEILDEKSIEKSYELNLFLVKLKGKIDFQKEINLENISLTELFQLIKIYSKKPVLFLFDEFQELGRGETDEKQKNNKEFVMLLRTILDSNRDFFKSIFTGSSFYDVNEMFNNYSQPFYKFGTQLKLIDLGENFIDFIIKQFKKENGFLLKKQDLLDVFNENNKLPSIIIELIDELEFYGENYENKFDVKTAYLSIKQKQINLLKNNLYERLNELDKNVIRRILISGIKMSSKESVEWIANKCIKNKVNRATVLASLNKLKSLNIIKKEKSLWTILNNDIKTLCLENC